MRNIVEGSSEQHSQSRLKQTKSKNAKLQQHDHTHIETISEGVHMQELTFNVNHNDNIIAESERKNYDVHDEQYQNGTINNSGGSHGITSDHPTTYLETLMHLFKGNIGSGLFAMGDAFKNAGIILAPILTVALGIVCVHSQHLLINCANEMRIRHKSAKSPDFAETVGLCFECGPPKLRPWANLMKLLVNIFICVTQLGFCCVYFVFISSNLKQVLDHFDLVIDVHLVMAMIFIPILLPSLITNLKYLAWCSTVANFCMITGLSLTLYYACQSLPPISDRPYVASWSQLPLYFGTAIFAFEGISLVLPLQNSMKIRGDFPRGFGVLNVGMVLVTIILTSTGFLGYLKYGEEVEGSLTLNIPKDEILALCVKIMISVGVLLGYALQFFVAIEILWPSILEKYKFKYPLIGELCFRTMMVLLTFVIAEAIPKLGLVISLIGALCSTALALIFPPLIQMISCYTDNGKGPSAYVFTKNIGILIVAFIGFSTGTYESLSAIAKEFT